MNWRRISGWGLVFLIAAVAVLSYFGNRNLFYAFIGLIVPFLIFHALTLCSRCTNVHCPLNARSSDYVFRVKKPPKHIMLGYSDMDILWTLTPLGLIVIIPLIAVWQLSPFIFFTVFVLVVLNVIVYRKESCRFCTNNCPMNKNDGYWEWKKRQKKQG